MRAKKAQAAMEFLMTYGWAILVVLGAIAVLAHYGVLSPNNLLADRTISTSGFDVIDQASVYAGSETFVVTLKNNIGTDISITEIIPATGSEDCTNIALTSVDGGGGGVDVNDGGTVTLNNGDTVLIECKCGDDIQPGRAKINVKIEYETLRSGQIHYSNLDITARASDGSYELEDPGTPEPDCGDGVAEGDEVCDDGDGINGVPCDPDYGSSCTYCNAACTQEIIVQGGQCGDGTTNNPDEVCDDGDGINGVYGGNCNADCTGYTGYCTDGNLDYPNEQCENDAHCGDPGMLECVNCQCLGTGPSCDDHVCDPEEICYGYNDNESCSIPVCHVNTICYYGCLPGDYIPQQETDPGRCDLTHSTGDCSHPPCWCVKGDCVDR